MTNRKRRYLSARVMLWGIASVLLTAVLLCCALYIRLKTHRSVWPVLLGAAALLGLILWGWVRILRPYHRLETELLHFFDVHTHLDSTLPMVSPANEQLLLQTAEMLSPSRLFHMNKRQAQYLALQNQINPHFLYNTLDSIRSEAIIAKLDSVADMTEALALFFRYTISKVENLVSVEEELQNCETYFRIQQYRFGERLSLRIDCDPAERDYIYRCRLPKLTMQPILENGIIHGTEQKLGTGHLTISLELTDKRLLIRISDDGVGMDSATLARLNGRFGQQSAQIYNQEKQTGGLALVNVDNRIRLLFGEEYGLHVFSLPDCGTDVEITLPAITSEREVWNSEVLQ